MLVPCVSGDNGSDNGDECGDSGGGQNDRKALCGWQRLVVWGVIVVVINVAM